MKKDKESKEFLNIAIVSPGYPPEDGGGIGTYTYNLAQGLKKRGHKVFVITQTPAEEGWKDVEGVRVFRYQYRYLPKIEKLLPGLRWSFFLAQKIAELDKEFHFDLVEFPNWEGAGLIYLLKRNRKKMVTRMHTPYFETLMIDKQNQVIPLSDSFICWMEKKACQLSDGLVSSTVCHRDIMVKHYSLNKDKITILPLGIQLAPFSADQLIVPKEDKLKVLYVSRLEKRKGAKTFLDSIPQVLENFPNVEFLIVGKDRPHAPGDKTFREYFMSHYRPYENYVKFYGFVSAQDLEQFYRGCDVFVVPSVYESFGLIYIEAMMHGKPVIGCRAGGIPEVIDDQKTGILIEPNHDKDLALAIIRLLRDEKLRAEFGRNARQACEERFSYELMAQRTEELYRKVIG